MPPPANAQATTTATNIIGYTQRGKRWQLWGAEVDALGRTWWKPGPGVYLASWLCVAG